LGKIPSTFELSPNFPNPFNAKTKIQYGLPQSNHVVIRIYNTLGQTVKELVNGEFSAGYYETIWDATDMTNREVRSGIYFLHMKAADFSKTKKLLLLR
jgi:flagellar hook assembly protein FlgD